MIYSAAFAFNIAPARKNHTRKINERTRFFHF
ncbi:hypothetical protein [Superficieibacter electus]